jgi:hypothetical protein
VVPSGLAVAHEQQARWRSFARLRHSVRPSLVALARQGSAGLGLI